jgi:crotonobetainyl-CoA:carnitine CoA-transferase CaiB-like acyl-CoA transferase
VLELGSMYAAPTAGRMLRDFGANVIKVEDPKGGDFSRQWLPAKDGQGLGFVRLNSGKRSLGLDMRSEKGRELVLQLAGRVDVVIESFRPGRLESWGLGYDRLSAANPGLILTRVSGFGQTGPYSSRPGFGTVAETGSGFANINGWPDTPPTSPPFGFADSIAGISAAFGTLMALYRRQRDNRGDVVDVALYEPLMRNPGPRGQRHGLGLAAWHLSGRRRQMAVDRRVKSGHRGTPVQRHGPARTAR